ncbi:MAG: DNA polymerase III subunit gamma/tau [Candidatus Kerfeldbacteria bacterium]|nr:DNA polymerase III subunit gamma/tau [Candidatus Kerfeldbacteria bacterium]
MAMTLYRKYRPQRFADLVGQNAVRTTLLAELETGKIAHAYLFVGPRGIGKTTTARLLAKAVNCRGLKKGEPDNTCESCQSISQGRSLDLVEIDAASHTQVDHVREQVLPAVRTVPSLGKYKVFVIDEVHMLSASAFSALLKVVEEPPAHVIFILATTEPHRVPATVISRCQRFDFRRIPEPDMIERLGRLATAEDVHVDRTVLQRIAQSAGGSLRDAESLLGQLLGLGEKHLTDDHADLVLPRLDRELVISLLEAIVQGHPSDALRLVQRLVDEGIHLSVFMREVIQTLRAMVIAKVGLENSFSSFSERDRRLAQQFVERASLSELQQMIEVFLWREREERSAVIPQLPLELAIVELTSFSDDQPPPGNHNAGPPAPQARTVTRATRPPDKRRMRLELSALQAGWTKVVDQVRQTNASLAWLLKTAVISEIDDDILTLAFRYALHRDRLLVEKNRAAVEAALDEVFQRPIRIKVVTDEAAKSGTAAPSTQVADTWQQALQAFGGEAASEPEGV